MIMAFVNIIETRSLLRKGAVVMKNIPLIVMLLFIIFAFLFNLLGLMNLVSIFITSPILFIALLLFISYLNNRNRFKGF